MGDRRKRNKIIKMQCTDMREILNHSIFKSCSHSFARKNVFSCRRFSELAAEFLLGKDSPAIKEGRVVSQQCCSNGNAVGADRRYIQIPELKPFFFFKQVRVMLDFLRWALEAQCVYISDPAWLTHDFMAARAGYDVRWYRYWDARGRRVDWEGLLEDLGAAPEGSVVILQPCGHNPTGIDPSK